MLKFFAKCRDPRYFFSRIHPHIDQNAVSTITRNVGKGFMLVVSEAEDYANNDSLRQHQYPIRTALQ